MDPDSNLAEQLAIVARINAARDGAAEDTGSLDRATELDVMDDAFRLAELVEALNTWICRGGALPLGWVKGIKRTAR